MALSYNTGATATADNSASVNLSIPSGVLTGDMMLLSLTVFTEDSSAPSVAFSGAGGTWTAVSPTDSSANPQTSAGSGVWSYGYAYYRIATAGDPGATLTITETGSPAGTTWLAAAAASYPGGGGGSPVDVAGGAEAFGSGGLQVTCPSLTTSAANDWAVYLGAGSPGAGSSFTAPAGTTQRQAIVSDAGIGAVIFDSNGSVGAGGTSIGGGQLGTASSGVAWLTVFTVAAEPYTAPPINVPPVLYSMRSYP